jgi:hypothetical protein
MSLSGRRIANEDGEEEYFMDSDGAGKTMTPTSKTLASTTSYFKIGYVSFLSLAIIVIITRFNENGSRRTIVYVSVALLFLL